MLTITKKIKFCGQKTIRYLFRSNLKIYENKLIGADQSNNFIFLICIQVK